MNLADTIQNWLQGEINSAVDGHSSRLLHLETNLSHAQYIVERVKLLEAKAQYLDGYLASVNERLLRLEKAYPDMATTHDMLKATNPATLADAAHPFIERAVRDIMQDNDFGRVEAWTFTQSFHAQQYL